MRRRAGPAAVGIRSAIRALIAGFLLGGVAAAQDQWAVLLGTVTDESGAVVSDASVVIVAPSRAETLETDARGAFRARALLPGTYAVEVRKAGFRTEARDAVRLAGGQTLQMHLVLRPATHAERVEVVASPPLIDIASHTARTVVPREMILRLPKGRDFTSLAAAATPGTNQERKTVGLQVDGASGAENQFFVDGIATTDVASGLSGKEAIVDFLEEVQIVSSGFSAANRVTTGGAVSAITRSGTGEWRGSIGTYYDGTGVLAGSARPVLRLSPLDELMAEYVTPPDDRRHTWEPVVDIGGPLLRDRLWIYLGYSGRTSSTSRDVRFLENGASGTFDSSTREHNVYSSLTFPLWSAGRARVSAVNERDRGGVLIPEIDSDGTTFENPELFPSRIRTDRQSQLFSTSLDGTAGRDIVVSITGGVYTSGARTKNAYTGYRRAFATSNLHFQEIPPELRHATSYADNPRPFVTLQDDFSRLVVDARATAPRRWFGDHRLTAGVQFERLANTYDTGEQSPTITLFWDRAAVDASGASIRGRYGVYRVDQRYRSGDVSDSNVGVFVQDGWRVADHLTLDLGVRADRESLPSYRRENPGIVFGFTDKIAPRLGFAWDPSRRGRARVYGGWGMFLDMTKLMLPRQYFGARHATQSLLTLDSPEWTAISCSAPAVPGPDCPGSLIRVQDLSPADNRPDAAGRPTAVDPDLRPFRTQELTLGVERQFGGGVLLGARYIRKWLDRAVEDVLVRTDTPEDHLPDTDLSFRIVNPGFGLAGHPMGPAFPAMPQARRNYDAVDFRFTRHLANRWSLNATYTLSRLRGNYSGLVDTDLDMGLSAPNVEPAFDDPRQLLDTTGREVRGRLATDRPHVAKVQATYDLPWGTGVGMNAFLASGTPLQRYTSVGPVGAQRFYNNRGSDGRTPAVSGIDLVVQHRVRLPRERSLEVEATILNVLDQATVVDYWMSRFLYWWDFASVTDEELLNGWYPEAAAAEMGSPHDPQFRMASAFQDRRSARVALRLRF